MIPTKTLLRGTPASVLTIWMALACGESPAPRDNADFSSSSPTQGPSPSSFSSTPADTSEGSQQPTPQPSTADSSAADAASIATSGASDESPVTAWDAGAVPDAAEVPTELDASASAESIAPTDASTDAGRDAASSVEHPTTSASTATESSSWLPPCQTLGSCAIGTTCSIDGECSSNTCQADTCVVSSNSCADGRRNGSESDQDCGGADCSPCVAGSSCVAPEDCLTSNCAPNGTCVLAGQGQACEGNSQCLSAECDLETNRCSAGFSGAACTTNGDCYSLNCLANARCGPGATDMSCRGASDCLSGVCNEFFCAISRPMGGCIRNADCSSQQCVDAVCDFSKAREPCTFDSDCTTAACEAEVCAVSAVGSPCRENTDCTSGTCSAGGVCAPGYTGATCSGPADCQSQSCTSAACDQSELGEGCSTSDDCIEGACSLGVCSLGPECNADTAVDLGETGQTVVVALDGCAKIEAGYPSWWGTSRRLSLMPSEGAGYPLPVQIFNACTGLSVALTFTSNWNQLSVSPTDANCPTVIDLKASTSGTVTLTYFGG